MDVVAIYVVCGGRLLANVRLNLRQVFATSLWQTCRLMFFKHFKDGLMRPHVQGIGAVESDFWTPCKSTSEVACQT